jgi:predicted alpha/beta superfamily hydrolase
MKKNDHSLMRRPILMRLTAIMFLLLATAGIAQPQQPYIFTNTQILTAPSAQSGLMHQLIISLPASYQTEPTKRYPVVYYLDAYWDFPLLHATYGNLRYDRAITEAILVGLNIDKEKDIGAYRARYFTMEKNPQENLPTGDAQLLYQHLTADIIPLIDKQFRTQAQPSGRVLAGQSKGGVFALYALYQQPAYFQRFVAVNPAVSGNEKTLLQLDGQHRAQSKSLPARVFISHGTEEYTPFATPIQRFKKHLHKRRYQGLELRNQTLEDMGHTGGKGEAYSKGLLWVLKDISPPEKSGLQVDMGG